MPQRLIGLAACCVLLAAGSACHESSATRAPSKTRPITVYCSVDTEFAEPILRDYAKRLNIEIVPVFDTEAGKTTGLIQRLLAEKARPRADVWWSSEVFGTITLGHAGVLAPYRPATAADIPPRYIDAGSLWTAIGLRGRVIAYDPKRTNKSDVPMTWPDLTAASGKLRIAIADPRFGTTRGHMAALLTTFGEARFKEWLTALHNRHPVVVDGNAESVRMLQRGIVDLAVTDTDDALYAKRNGAPVELIIPNLTNPTDAVDPSQLWIPCTAALVAGGPNPDDAKRLIDLLVSADTERALYKSESRNIPVRPALQDELQAHMAHPAAIDYGKVADVLSTSDRLVREILLP